MLRTSSRTPFAVPRKSWPRYVLAEPTERETIKGICDRLLVSIACPIAFADQSLVVGLSMGVAWHPNDGKDLASLMHAADRALYYVKRSGRGQYAFFDELSKREQSKVEVALLEQAARQANDTNAADSRGP